MTGFLVPGLKELVQPMLHRNHHERPTAMQVLKAFRCMARRIPAEMLKTTTQDADALGPR